MKGLAAFAWALAVASCSLVIDTGDRTQCETTADCEANPAFRGRECRLGFCALRTPQTELVSTDAGEPCASTELCTQRLRRAAVCKRIGGPCVQWAIDDACSVYGDWADENAIVVGSLVPLTIKQVVATTSPFQIPYSQRLQRAMDLAVDEVNDKATEGFFVGGKARPLAIVHCDTQGTPAVARERFTHLTEVVGVSAVIVGWSDDLDALATHPRAKDTTFICSDCLTPPPPSLRTWRILPSIVSDAHLVAWRVAELEKEITAGAPRDIKVAVLTDGAKPQQLFSETLDSVLTFNGGKSTAANGATRYLVLQTEDPREKPIPFDRYARDIAAFQPDIVIAAMARDFPEQHLPRIEESWPVGRPKPFYVLTQISYDAAVFDDLLHDDALRRRISGTHPFTTTELAANVAGFETRYRKVYKNEAPNGNSSGYEAFYAVALAVGANIGRDALDIASGFQRLVAGDTYDVGPAKLAATLAKLGTGASVDVRGLYTELDWRPDGSIESDMGMFCFTRTPGGPLALHDVPTVRWSARTKQVTGTFSCP